MIRRLTILLLIVGCEELLLSKKEGCTTATACNYDATATQDNGSCVDPQGCNEWCVGDTLSAQDLDCAGVCGGVAICGCTDINALNYSNEATFNDGSCSGTHISGCILDSACNYCSGCTRDCNNTDAEVSGADWIQNDACCLYANEGCACSDGVHAVADNCGTCDTDSSNDCVQDCAGVYGGTSWVSDCGCVLATNSGNDCDDCAGTPNGSAVVDNCGTCDNDNDCVQDCAGTWGGNLIDDECGECGGDGSSCQIVSLEIKNVDIAAGILDIYMKNTSSFCTYCTGSIHAIGNNEEYGCGIHGGTFVAADDEIPNAATCSGVCTNSTGVDVSQYVNKTNCIVSGICSNSTYTGKTSCGAAGGTWTNNTWTKSSLDGQWFDGNVGGLQFKLTGIKITNVTGGRAETANFTFSFSNSVVMLYSLVGTSMPVGEGVLVTIGFTDFDGTGICFGKSYDACSNASDADIVSDSSPIALCVSSKWGNCYTP